MEYYFIERLAQLEITKFVNEIHKEKEKEKEKETSLKCIVCGIRLPKTTYNNPTFNFCSTECNFNFNAKKPKYRSENQ